jgi:hypothetical protein
MATYSVVNSDHFSSNGHSFQASPREETNQSEESVEHLRTQLATLMNSLATLSAEKSRMEASFQADKKQLRSEKEEVLLKHFKPQLVQISFEF